MLKFEVRQLASDVWQYVISREDVELIRGFRPSEGIANKDGSEDLRLCRLFSLGFKAQ